MSNHYNWNCFVCQKLQLFSKAMKPKVNFARYITMAPLTDSMPEFFPWLPLPTQLNQTKKMSNHYNWNCFACQKLQLFSKAMKPKANFAHWITLVPLTDSMPEFSLRCLPLPTQLNQAKKMSNHYNWNCFAFQKLQLFSKAMKAKASFVHFKLSLTTFSLETTEGGHPKIKCHRWYVNLLMMLLVISHSWLSLINYFWFVNSLQHYHTVTLSKYSGYCTKRLPEQHGLTLFWWQDMSIELHQRTTGAASYRYPIKILRLLYKMAHTRVV